MSARFSARARSLLYLTIATLIWGATFIMVSEALRTMPPFRFLFLRFLLGGLLLVAASRFTARPWFRSRTQPESSSTREAGTAGVTAATAAAIVPAAPGRGLYTAGILLGVSLFCGFATQTYGLLYTTPSRSAFLTEASIPLVPILMALVLRRHPGRTVVTAFGLVIAGIYLLTGADLGAVNRGDLLTLACAFFFAGQILLMDRFARDQDGIRLVAIELLTTAALAGIGSLFEPWTPLRSGALYAVAFTAYFPTAWALLVQAECQRTLSATETALILALEPVFASATAFLVTGERLSTIQNLGALLILLGVVYGETAGRTAEVEDSDRPERSPVQT